MTDCAKSGVQSSTVIPSVARDLDGCAAEGMIFVPAVPPGPSPSLPLRVGVTSSRLVIAGLRLLLFLLFGLVVRLFLQTIGLLLRKLFAQLQVAFAVEVDLPFDEGRVDARVGRQRMPGPEIGRASCRERV